MLKADITVNAPLTFVSSHEDFQGKDIAFTESFIKCNSTRKI